MHTPTNVFINGTSRPLTYIKIDTISNLPCGLCWAMGASNFQIAGNSTGCIKISGTTYDAPGQYQMHIIADITGTFIGFPFTQTNQDLTTQGLKYFLKVQLPGDTCIRIDTLAPSKRTSPSGVIPTPQISGNNNICVGSSTTLSATGSNYYAYSWSNGSFNSSITVSAPGIYTVTVYGNCSSATASVSVANIIVADTITTSQSTTFCQGDSIILNVAPGNTYHWSTGATTSNIYVNSANTYTVTVTTPQGCSAVSPGVTTTVNPVPAIPTISANGPTSFCPGGSVLLTGPAGYNYSWSNGNTGQSITVNQSSTVTLAVINNNNCSSVSNPFTVTIYPVPNSTVAASGPTTFCPGDSVVLLSTAGLSYNWSNGATTQSIAVKQAGNYSLTVTSSNNCTAASSTTTISLLSRPDTTVTASGSTALCSGGSVAFTAASGLGYQWSTGSNAQSILVTQTGTYYVTVTNGNNCSAVSSPQIVSVAGTPVNTVNTSGPTTFCAGGSVTINAAAGLTYRWSNSATTQSISVTQAGSYKVTVTNSNGCSAVSSPVVVTVNSNPDNSVSTSGSLTFCAGGSVTLTAANGLSYRWSNSLTTQALAVTQSGSYTVTVTNSNSCSAVSTAITVTANSLPNATVNASGPTTFCTGGSVTLNAPAGLSYHWSNGVNTQSITVTQGGTYIVTVTNTNQCSASSSPTVVTVNAATTITSQPVSQVTCVNGQVTFSVTAGGAALTYQWQKNGANINGQTGTSFNIAQAALSDTGSYRVIIHGTCGTDTSNTANLSVSASLTFSQQPQSKIACLGSPVSFSVVANGVNDTYQWKKNGQNITGATAATYNIAHVAITDTGSYTCFVTSNCGNATSAVATLKIIYPTSSSFSRTICGGSSYYFNGRNLTNSGTYLDTLVNAAGCDSTITLTLTVNADITHNLYDSICTGSTYNFNGAILHNAGVYTDTLITTAGCDSIVILHLGIKQHVNSDVYASICQGSSYTFNGTTYSNAGTYSATLAGTNGCDSVVTLHLTVNQSSASSINVTICNGRSYNFNGRTLTTAGVYRDTINNHFGCDSTITLTLSVSPSVSYSYNVSICSGASYNFNGRILNSSGIYNDTLPAGGTCDSIVTLHLTVYPAAGSSVNATICANSTYSFYGRILSTSGTYYDTLRSVHNCDSIITLNLTVNAPIRTGIHAGICTGSTYSFNGQNLNTSGTYYAHYTSQAGCDSMVTLVLQVGPYVNGYYNASICQGSSYTFNGRQLTTAGTYSDTITAHGGCDSIVTLTLTVNQPSAGNIQASICNGSSYSFNGQHLTTAGTYTETITNSNGCDSVVTLTLQTTSFVTGNVSATICNGSSYNFNNQTLTAAGIYKDTLTAQGGCDSIVTLNLSVTQQANTTINAAICVGTTYTFNNLPLSATGTYFESLTGSSGCDSIVTLNLVVNSFITNSSTVNICHGGSYQFFGRTLTNAGTYTDTLTAQGGCDSIIAINLVINPYITHTTPVAICTGSSYNFNGRQLTVAGTYRDTLTTASGCDSISIIQLSINPILTGSKNVSICVGGTYNFNGHLLADSGTYVDTVITSGGCDSIITLNLSFIQEPQMQQLNRAVCLGAAYNFDDHLLYTAGNYIDTLVSVGGCDSVINQLTLVNIDTTIITWAQPDTICDNTGATQITLVAPEPTGGTLSGANLSGLVLSVTGTGVYPVTYTITGQNNCNSSITKNLVVETCLGINEPGEESIIDIYPNPANNMLVAQLQSTKLTGVKFELYNIQGQAITIPFVQQADKIIFDTNNLEAGIYLIKFNINGKVTTRRFVRAD